MRNVVKAFKALSDDTRLRIINVLMERGFCIGEVMQALEIPQSKASRGLIALHNAGFLKMRRERLWSLYSLDEERIKGYRYQLIEAVRKALKDNEIAALDQECLKKTECVGTNCISSLGNGVSCKAVFL
ncbi:MAG: metalloregulator ArsR/SmtB family transcription factor [Chloroflexi bacterium]|nr:metalloregulator ArsR/SmtB family transcription factor [Chloroflexota bacterium]